MALTPSKFGDGQKYRKDQPEKWQQGRAEDHQDKDQYKKAYTNTAIWRDPSGFYSMRCWEKDKEFFEWGHPSGAMVKILPNGSIDITSPSNMRVASKEGLLQTNEGPNDSMTKGHARSNIDGGQFGTVKGNRNTFVAGSDTTAGAQNSVGGYYCGKKCTNAEGGIGFGVNKGSDMKAFMRMEADGTYHLQVKPKGEEGGNAVVKIKPDGSIEITSESTMSVETKQPISIKAPSMTVDAQTEFKKPVTISAGGQALTMQGNFQHTGNYNQNGVHTDNNGTHG